MIWDDLSEEAIVRRPVRSHCNRPGNRICGTEKDFSSEMMRRKRFFFLFDGFGTYFGSKGNRIRC